MFVKESVKVGDRLITLETGRVAKQASGSVLISCDDTVVLVTATGAKSGRPGADFLPLTVDYVEKTYAAGKIPGGFFKREGKLRDQEVLTARLIDRPCRPLFPEGYRSDIQVLCTVLSLDPRHPADVLALSGTSAALSISPIPWAGPVAGVRVGRVDGRFVANPTLEELSQSDCDLMIAASKDAIVMVEGQAQELGEAELADALFFGKEAVQPLISLISAMQSSVGKPKWPKPEVGIAPEIHSAVKEQALDGFKAACQIAEKHARSAAFSETKSKAASALAERFPEDAGDVKTAIGDLQYDTMRAQVLDEGRRVDGRDFRTVRPITIEPGFLPRPHGSCLFTRGETQAIVTVTLGTAQDEQKIDGLQGEFWKRFLLHYNFPAYSVGETKPLRGPGRREIGHGTLAERALAGVIPDAETFPYTLRIVSEITESNGSSSMASVCGGSLAMMAAGVPIKSAVAGVAMGLIKEGDKYAILTDILGDEDHLGDMDFKVCGTSKGVTAIQMDIKIEGLSRDIVEQALSQAREARLHVLNKMNEVLPAAREELSPFAPRIHTIRVKPEQIRTIIGPGGKMIKGIVDQTGANVDVKDDGTVTVASPNLESVQKALAIIESLTTEPEVGQTYKGIVRRVEAYGAFLEVMPGHDGLLHISDMAWERVDSVESVMNLGDEVEVSISNVDREGRIRLSRKALLEKPEGYVEPEPRPEGRSFGGGRSGGGRRGGGQGRFRRERSSGGDAS